jgi:hypothetical protein
MTPKRRPFFFSVPFVLGFVSLFILYGVIAALWAAQ